MIFQSLKGAHTISSDEGGLLLDQAEFIISSIKKSAEEHGIETGVSIANGRIVGSVSELDGFDVEEKSAQAAIRMVNALIS